MTQEEINKEKEKRAKYFLEEYRKLTQKHRVSLRAVITRYGLELEVQDIKQYEVKKEG